ncbi:MAG: hypothetical protein R2881_05620 [Eubacteriales bacterium]
MKLYRVVGTTLTLITSGSNTVTGTTAYVSRSATLSAGQLSRRCNRIRQHLILRK